MGETPDPGFVDDDFLYAAHPNPGWARRDWMSLDGVWKVEREGTAQDVRVPFPLGSEESGSDFPDTGTFVYSRAFEPPAAGRSVLLRVGACDYETVVYVNGREAGRHVGGYASFSLDISDLVRPGSNELVLRVRDSRSPFQARGKQTFLPRPFMVWYAGIAGVWQPVWLETAGSRYLERASVKADFQDRVARIEATLSAPRPPADPPDGPGEGRARPFRLDVEIQSAAGTTFRFHSDERGADDVFRLVLPFDAIGAEFWSPDTPRLYRLRYTLSSGTEVLDAVESYFGLREIDVSSGRILLNGEPVFLRMALVQGYYPGGIYTPRTHGRERDDILALKRMGFNGARIHEKIESPYFHYLCDRLGLLTTYEMPSFYLPSRKGFRAYERELREIVGRDSGHPSAIAWILFNETWGVWGMYGRNSKTRRFVREMVDLIRKLDSERLVIDNSGWEHFDADIVDVHHYLKTSVLARRAYAGFHAGEPGYLRGASGWAALLFYLLNRIGTRTRPVFLDEGAEKAARARGTPWLLSEYGGFGWYESGEGGSTADKIEAYTRDAVDSGVFRGYCLTQLYDVGSETNGLLTFDRTPKIPEDRMRNINAYGRPLE